MTTANFAGQWYTTFGPMELTQDSERVQGHYKFQGNRCTLQGTVSNNRLQFSYSEPNVDGEGWFDLIRYGKFAGQWRANNSPRFASWTGERGFEGIWESSFGLLRVIQEPDRIFGFYEGAGPSSIEGRMEKDRFVFRYREAKTQGEGYFELAPDNARFEGRWRADRQPQWSVWDGRRLAPLPGVMWLVVIEAYWQRSYLEREYAFGNMLREFFTRLQHVNIRQRFFEDETGLERWCRELMYIPDPVAVVIASHGSSEGLTVQGKPLDTARLVESLRYADNVVLLHFSSCLMLEDSPTAGLARALQQALRFPISGYDRSVDWGASALIEFHYLDMVLCRGLTPADAADQVRRLIRYAGDEGVPGSPYASVGFRIYMPENNADRFLPLTR
jgi:hypothetical protein